MEQSFVREMTSKHLVMLSIGRGNRNRNLFEFGVFDSNDRFDRNHHCVSDWSIFGDAGHDVFG